MRQTLTLDAYQTEAKKTWLGAGNMDIGELMVLALGVTGEAGEVADIVKKIYRDQGGTIEFQNCEDLIKELGDVLWYVAVLSEYLGCDLSIVGQENLDKLKSRQERNVLHGSGDNR